VAFALSNDALVLEIGSGANPQKRSDILIDRFYIDSIGHRHGQEIYKDKRPLIVADGERLPFIDKAFDYVYCVHVVEHTDNPAAFLDEMSRVSKAGYLECPNPALEKILDAYQHLWYITNDNGKLLIHPKTKDNCITGTYDKLYFHTLFSHYLARHYWDMFTVMLNWTDHIEYKMCPDVDSVILPLAENSIEERMQEQKIKVLTRALFDAVKEKVALKIAENKPLLKSLRDFRRRSRYTLSKARVTLANIEPLLCCPHDKGKLTKSETAYHCKDCGREYLIQDGVPIFL
jgi:SAM-dependent methyltransferase